MAAISSLTKTNFLLPAALLLLLTVFIGALSTLIENDITHEYTNCPTKGIKIEPFQKYCFFKILVTFDKIVSTSHHFDNFLVRGGRHFKDKHHLHDLHCQAWSAYLVLQVMIGMIGMTMMKKGRMTIVFQRREQGNSEEVQR